MHRQGITELIVVMVKVESFIELGPSKDKFKSSKPKRMGNSGGGYEKYRNGNGKNSGNRRPHNGKLKPNNKPNGLVK